MSNNPNRGAFLARIQEAVAWMQDAAPREIVIFHHNDADGLSSAAILNKALDREGITPRRFCLEKPYPQVLRAIMTDAQETSAFYLFVDFGSGMLPEIMAIAPAHTKVLVLDHHSVSPCCDSRLFLVNPVEFGFSGREEASASVVAFLFAKILRNWNEDLAPLALLGLRGDGQINEHGIGKGFAAELLAEALRLGTLCERDSGLYMNDGMILVDQVVSTLNVLGSFAYLQGGPDIGVKGISDSVYEDLVARAKPIQKEYQDHLEQFLLSVTLHKIGDLTWFSLDGFFEKAGVKTVGLLCEEIVSRGIVQGECYLLGMQKIPRGIPGIGPLEIPETKISMRITSDLLKRINNGERKSLVDILPPAAETLGGLIDACHPHAAAVTVSSGREEELLSRVLSRL